MLAKRYGFGLIRSTTEHKSLHSVVAANMQDLGLYTDLSNVMDRQAIFIDLNAGHLLHSQLTSDDSLWRRQSLDIIMHLKTRQLSPFLDLGATPASNDQVLGQIIDGNRFLLPASSVNHVFGQLQNSTQCRLKSM